MVITEISWSILFCSLLLRYGDPCNNDSAMSVCFNDIGSELFVLRRRSSPILYKTDDPVCIDVMKIPEAFLFVFLMFRFAHRSLVLFLSSPNTWTHAPWKVDASQEKTMRYVAKTWHRVVSPSTSKRFCPPRQLPGVNALLWRQLELYHKTAKICGWYLKNLFNDSGSTGKVLELNTKANML